MTSTTTLQAWVDEVRYFLEAPLQGQVNVLASAYTSGGTSLTFTYPLKGIVEGAVLSIGEHTLLVVATDEPTKVATVIPSYASSTPANAAIGALVRVNPRFTDHRIVKALNEHLAQLSSPGNGLYQTATTALTYTCGVQGYDLGASPIRVLQVNRQGCATELSWPRVRGWELLRDADTSIFPSGTGIRITDQIPAGPLRVAYAAPYTAISGGSTLVSTSGIQAEAEDIPPLGAAIRLMAGREVGRNTLSSQGNTRRAQEVSQGAVQNSWQGLAALWRQRVAEEASRLRAAHAVGM